jgi:phosphoribosylamine--glycine ligase
MRYLGVGESCDLGALYWRLSQDGHEVKIFISDPHCSTTFDGLVEKTADWRAELPWVGKDGIILFESVLGNVGAVQDKLRADGYRVIGGSAYGDRLENERAFAQDVLAANGFRTLTHWEFEDAKSALDFVRQQPARYVLKFNGYGSVSSFVGRLNDGVDVIAVLTHLVNLRVQQPKIVLTQFVDGIEMGVGGYFTGKRFLSPACLDWEHKRFFPDDLGELTPEMGTVVAYDGSQKFFRLTLGRLETHLRDNGYQGYINLNTIVNADGIWPLEFTCRFGYPGFAILEELQQASWTDIFEAMISDQAAFAVRPGYAVGVVITTPPFPYTRHQVAEPVNLPIIYTESLTPAEERRLHYGEVRLTGGELVTSGMYGWTMVVTGSGKTISTARESAYELVKKILIPNARYRHDIGAKLLKHDLERLTTLGLVSEHPTLG